MSGLIGKRIVVIYLTFFVGLALAVWPLPDWAVWFRPEWLLLITFYWAIALPHRVNIGTAWFLGLLLDVLYGTPLGEHALAFSLVTYFVVKIYLQMRVLPLWQQALIVGLLLLFYQLVNLSVQGMLGVAMKNGWFWLSAIVSALLWPWVFILLRDCRRWFHID